MSPYDLVSVLDFAFVRWLNGFAGRSFIVDRIGITIAMVLVFVIGAAVIVVITQRASTARALFVAEVVGTLVIAYAVSQFIGVVAFRERPFVRHSQIHWLILKNPGEKSFPSDHATLAFAMAIPAAVAVRRRWVGACFLIAASLVGLGRVFVGVHYVSDVIAGGLLAWVVWWFVHRGAQRWWRTKSTLRT